MWALVSRNPGVPAHFGVAVQIGSNWSVRCEQEIVVSACGSGRHGGREGACSRKANLIKVNVILVSAV